jgi:hypothetical protein
VLTRSLDVKRAILCMASWRICIAQLAALAISKPEAFAAARLAPSLPGDAPEASKDRHETLQRVRLRAMVFVLFCRYVARVRKSRTRAAFFPRSSGRRCIPLPRPGLGRRIDAPRFRPPETARQGEIIFKSGVGSRVKTGAAGKADVPRRPKSTDPTH